MEGIEWLRSALKMAHEVVQGTIEGVTDEQAHWQPAGWAHSIAATYAHLAVGGDIFVARLRGTAPLATSTWEGRTGVSTMEGGGDPDWAEWARTVRLDMDAARQYGQAVYEAFDEFLAGTTPADLDSEIDSPIGKTPAWNIVNLMVVHWSNHAGEISAIKGLQGLKGYPF